MASVGLAKKENEVDDLYIVWTNSDEIVFDKMVAMYARTARIENYWNEITIIIWGSTPKLTAESEIVGQRIKELLQVGVKVSACKSCCDSFGVTEKIIDMGVEVKYWVEDFTRLIKEDRKILTI
jgi:hypothetical protein